MMARGIILLYLLCALIVPFFNAVAYRLPAAPYHRQFTEYSCGEGSLEMALHTYGSDVDQRALINIARSTNLSGTLVDDLRRAGHFSPLSRPPVNTYFPFPSHVPLRGWSPSQRFGFAAFSHRSKTCWVEELKHVLDQGYGVILLNWYDLNPNDGGHYRYAVGYTPQGSILLHDPWDRQGQPRLVEYNVTTMCALWNIAESNTDPYTNVTTNYLPYSAVVVSPWKVTVTAHLLPAGYYNISATIEYPCPAPFCTGDDESFPAKNVRAKLEINFGTLQIMSPSAEIKIADMKAGESAQVSWLARPLQDIEVAPKETVIYVAAVGEVRGKVVSRQGWTENGIYPGYHYTDLIGGRGSVWY